MKSLKDNMKTSWQIKEWVAKSLPHVDVNWSEAHFDKWQDEYDEFHSRDSTLWVKFNDVKEKVLEFEKELDEAGGLDLCYKILKIRLKEIFGGRKE